jgi:hypothetical protein
MVSSAHAPHAGFSRPPFCPMECTSIKGGPPTAGPNPPWCPFVHTDKRRHRSLDSAAAAHRGHPSSSAFSSHAKVQEHRCALGKLFDSTPSTLAHWSTAALFSRHHRFPLFGEMIPKCLPPPFLLRGTLLTSLRSCRSTSETSPTTVPLKLARPPLFTCEFRPYSAIGFPCELRLGCCPTGMPLLGDPLSDDPNHFGPPMTAPSYAPRGLAQHHFGLRRLGR